jgi:hypothetical protein
VREEVAREDMLRGLNGLRICRNNFFRRTNLVEKEWLVERSRKVGNLYLGQGFTKVELWPCQHQLHSAQFQNITSVTMSMCVSPFALTEPHNNMRYECPLL